MRTSFGADMPCGDMRGELTHRTWAHTGCMLVQNFCSQSYTDRWGRLGRSNWAIRRGWPGTCGRTVTGAGGEPWLEMEGQERCGGQSTASGHVPPHGFRCPKPRPLVRVCQAMAALRPHPSMFLYRHPGLRSLAWDLRPSIHGSNAYLAGASLA